MTGLASVPSSSNEHSRTKDLLGQIAAQLGVDPSLFVEARRRTVEPSTPSQAEIGEMVLAFSRIPDARDRNIVFRSAQVLASRSDERTVRALVDAGDA